jgi:NADH:ubiquinone oxidoreductase subunit 2 (subunit N)
MTIAVVTAMHSFAHTGMVSAYPGAGVRTDAIGSAQPWDIQGLIIYVLAYLFTNIGAFGVVVVVGRYFGNDKIESYSGLSRKFPFYAGAMVIFMLSLAGIPFTAGFMGKLLVFGSAVQVGGTHWELYLLAIAGVINSVISAFYYMNIVRIMYIKDSSTVEDKPFQVSNAASFVVAVSLVAVLLVFFFWKPISDLASQAVCNSASSFGQFLR